jgi:nucleoside-diphosphate-sugar epimerase
MSKNIFLWGAGWLGLPLAKSISESSNKVSCITRSREKKNFLISHSLNATTIDELVHEPQVLKKCDVFIVTVPPVAEFSFNESLSFFLKFLPQDCHVIHISSTGIYKNSDGLKDENSEIDSTKGVYQSEDFLQKNNHQNLTILRLGGLIGPKRHPVHFLAKKTVNENPNQVVNLVQQIDVIRIVLYFIESKKSGIFNVCSPEHPTRKEYYNLAAKAFGLKSLSFENDEHQSGKIVDTKKLVGLFPDFTFNSIYDFEKCK